MFKKPLANPKTSVPLRGSDRRKFKQRVVAAFGVSQDEGDQLVPEGLKSIKFSSRNQPGVAYLGPEGDPLWFTIGKDSDELIPTIYTLWKKQDLVPFVSTPPYVMPILVRGADLMIPGVIQCSTLPIAKNQLVSVCQYDHKEEDPTLSAPLVIGRMAISSDKMTGNGKGKAVFVLHAWNDHLWDMGSKPDVPEPTVIAEVTSEESEESEEIEEGEENEEGEESEESEEGGESEESEEGEEGEDSGPEEPSTQEQEQLSQTQTSHATTIVSHTPQEVTDILHKSLLQSISTNLTVSSFPIPSTQFYTNYILPCRPATTTNDVTIKNSTHKSLTAFLKAAEKASLLTVKSPQKHSRQTDLLVMSVNETHQSVLGHVDYETKEKAAKKAKREKLEKESGKRSELGVRLLWKPHLESMYLFERIGKEQVIHFVCLYTMQEIKTLLNSYISSRNLVNENDKAYTDLDDLLRTCIYAKQQSKPGMAGNTNASLLESKPIKREELVKKVIAKMQDWYEIVRNGETSRKQGILKPIQVFTKARGRKKALTFITGFEPFVTVGAETMADELKRMCASAASVSPLPGAGMRVMIQGKQSKAALEFLTTHDVPKQWIDFHHPQKVRRITRPTTRPRNARPATSGPATR
ncbi:eukaryotic translation initiation factor SUI1 family protein [Amanita muscaria]